MPKEDIYETLNDLICQREKLRGVLIHSQRMASSYEKDVLNTRESIMKTDEAIRALSLMIAKKELKQSEETIEINDLLKQTQTINQ
ncbi:MAG: hypothetical protein VB108_01325 [Anaerolineaceae bacterium]|nr:hypothetical protein [Anaerolineaceae bacterium]